MESQITPQDKKAFKFFGIEAVVILLLIIIILVILSVLDVIPLGSLIPGFPKAKVTAPTNTGKGYLDPVRARQIELEKNIIKDLPAEVSIVSDISSISASVNQEEDLIKLLKEWKVMGRVYDPGIYASGNMVNKPLEKLVIHVTDKKQLQNQYSNDGGITFYSSSYARLNPSRMDVSIQVDPAKRDTLSAQVMFQLTNILTKMTNPVNGTSEIAKRELLITSRFDAIRETSKNYFTF